MKRRFKKLASCIIVFITLINLFNSLFATPATVVQATGNTSSATVVNEIDEEELESDGVLTSALSVIGTGVDGLVGILSKIPQIIFLLIGMAFQGLIGQIAKIGGDKIEGFLTPDDILFNRVGITEIDFFNFTGETSVVNTIRTNIATWYYILRILAIIVLLAVLIYIGIRMAISTVASEQAQYKRMLTDWIVSFVILFLLNYIIIFTIEANNAFVAMLAAPARATIGSGIVNKLIIMSATSIRATNSWTAFIVYIALIGMTTAFLVTYIKRMLTIGFLIIISPLITITYAIDKVKDAKAQALNTWMKEFMFNVLIQPFHCIIYLVFISTIMNTLGTKASLAKMILAIICMKFMWTAEGIVKKIFGFKEASSLADTVAAGFTVKAIGDVAKRAGQIAGSAAGAVAKTEFGKNVATKVGNMKPVQAVKNSRVAAAAKAAGNTETGKAVKRVVAESIPIGAGIAGASYEMGLNTKANAMQVGMQAYDTARGIMYGNRGGPGSKQEMEISQKDLKRFSDLISHNNTFRFNNYTTNRTARNQLRAYVQSLIGTNMNHLDTNIQDALRDLSRSNPTAYNTTTAAGLQHLKAIQDMALDPTLDFTNPATNPLGHAWTTEERRVVTAIQTKNMAKSVNALYENRKAAGSRNPAQDVDDFVNRMS